MARSASAGVGCLSPPECERHACVRYRVDVSVAQTALVFAGIPIAVVAVFALLIFGPSQLRQPNRYRPGKPWAYPPVWYLPRPGPEHRAAGNRALGAPARPAIESAAQAPTPDAVGGASGEW